MKKLVLLSMLAVFLGSNLRAAEIVEAIVARVGDRIITRTQYLERLRESNEEIERAVPPAEVAAKKAELSAKLLDEMLTELLLKDRADRLNITVTKAEVDEAVSRLKRQYGIESEEQFNNSLQQSGLTRPLMEARLRDTLLTNKLFSRELRSRQELTDRELRDRYEREKEQYRLPERAELREIILLVPEGAPDGEVAAIEARAREIAEKARGGADLTALVREYSEAPSKDQGGSLGVVSRGELLPQLDAAIFSASAPAIIGPVRTRVGYHVMSLDKRLPSEVPGFETVREQLRRDASDETFQRDFKVYVENLRKDAFIEIHPERIAG